MSVNYRLQLDQSFIDVSQAFIESSQICHLFGLARFVGWLFGFVGWLVGMCTRGAYAQQRIGVGQCVVSGARDTGRETTTEHKTTINNTNTPNNNKMGVRDCWSKV